MKVRLIPSNQNIAERTIEIADDMGPQLAKLQDLVGGYVEQVRTNTLEFKRNVILVDEEGRVKGKPTNYRAMQISGYAGLLCGDVVICGYTRDEVEGDTWSDWNER